MTSARQEDDMAEWDVDASFGWAVDFIDRGLGARPDPPLDP